MKRSKFTSFLFTIALGLFAFNFSSAQTSADCQDVVNISIGAECNTGIPWEAFNSWRPSCMTIVSPSGMTMAVIAGSGSFQATKVDCRMPIDSFSLDTVIQSKVTIYKVDAWELDCDNDGNSNIYADLSAIPTLCNPDTLFTPQHGFIDPAALTATQTVINGTNTGCTLHQDSAQAADGKIFIKDSIVTYSIKVHRHRVYKVDTFSHTDPLRWVKGTAIMPDGSIMHDFSVPRLASSYGVAITTGDTKYTSRCALPAIATIFGSFKAGPSRLKPSVDVGGNYTYNSYTPDSSNVCWGEINLEYKLWPTHTGRTDTLNCVDLSDYSRWNDETYHPSTRTKLEDVCAWAEGIYTNGTGRVAPTSSVPGIGALRTASRVAYEINLNIRHCYTHTVTKKDEYVRNFDWLCDTVVKYRHFYADHPGTGGTKKISTDTLYIEPIELTDVKWPDSTVVMSCGYAGDMSPEAVANYLPAARLAGTIILDGPDGVGSSYTYGTACATFASQYTNGAPDICSKMMSHADYNNWGVAKAFPYVMRMNKLQDPGIKAKYGSTASTMSVVNIPVYKVVCNIAASKIDLHPIEVCPGENKVFRNWTLVDWCTGTTREMTQIIKTVDDTPPAVGDLDHKDAFNYSPTAFYLDGDDDNSKGQEDGYFGRLDLDNHDALDDATDNTSSNDGNFTQYLGADHGGYVPVRWEKVNPWGCTVKYTFPKPTVYEGCSNWEHTYELFDNTWNGSGGSYSAGDMVDIGWEHGEGMDYPIVKLTVWDECGNDDAYYWYLKAIDKLPPVVVLHDELVVTLTANNEDFVGTQEHGDTGTEGEGIAKVFAHMVDAGSHDGDCGDLTSRLIRRKGTDDDYVDGIHLDCDDIGTVEVEFQATDWSGNTSIGWMTITVENKRPPIIVCEDVVIRCTDPIHPDWVGPHVVGICSAPEIEYVDDYNVDNLCYTGYIDRTWSIIGSNVSCTQRITISSTDNSTDASVFSPASIRWPLHNNGKTLWDADWNTDWMDIYERDAHGNCLSISFNQYADATPGGSSPSSTERRNALQGLSFDDNFECEQGSSKEPTWTDPACGLVGKTFEDLHVKFNDGVCFKVLRTWTVIDWCVYDPKFGDVYSDDYVYVVDGCFGADPFIRSRVGGVDGYYTYVQEILVVDETQPQFTDDKMKIEVPVGAGSKTDDDACEEAYTITRTAYDECLDTNVSDVAEDGTKTEGPEIDWYVKLVKIDKETGAEKQVVIHPAYGLGWYPVAYGGNEVGNDELYSDENESGSASFTFTGAAHETYHVKWRIEDGCNNPNEIVDVVEFVDVKAPVLLCYADLSTNTMSNTGVAEVWANDYGHAYDCDGEEVPVWFKNDDGELVPSLEFTCEDLETRDDIVGSSRAWTWEGRVYAEDEKGNISFCEVTLRIVDTGNGTSEPYCGGTNSGASLVGNLFTTENNAVENAEVSMGDKSMMTGVDGQYAFDNNAMGLSYALTASKNDNHLNGVSTLDLVLIQKHILGLDQLDSPFKVIAADINNDAGVSAIDLVELRKVILGITNEFTNNTSWRFGDANQTFDDELNPFATFIEAINVDFLTADSNNDFIAIKVGDVSGNAIANRLMTDSRSNSSIAFAANDQLVNAGEMVSISFNSNDFEGMNAFQFTLNTAGLEFTNAIGGAIELSNENVAVFDGQLTAAWTSVEAVSTGDELFTLEFRALTDTRLSNAISMTSSITPARAYNSELERFNTTLVFNTEEGSTVGAAFELMQNSPNPFENATTIGFNLGEAGPATLTVFDVTGKTVRVEAGNFDRGYNEISLTKSELGTSGVLYYQLESGDFTATRKMILID